MKRAYFDSTGWIVYAEGFIEYKNQVNEHIHRLVNEGWKFCFSEAVLLEVLAKPRQLKQTDILKLYDSLFQNIDLLKNFDDLLRNALRVSESDSIKGLDAIHMAFALEYECELFVTTDRHFLNLLSVA